MSPPEQDRDLSTLTGLEAELADLEVELERVERSDPTPEDPSDPTPA